MPSALLQQPIAWIRLAMFNSQLCNLKLLLCVPGQSRRHHLKYIRAGLIMGLLQSPLKSVGVFPLTSLCLGQALDEYPSGETV